MSDLSADEGAAAAAVFSECESVGRYVDLLASRGVDRGLIGPREIDRLWSRHVLNSVAVVDLIPRGVSVVDVGSGAGLPGIPLALARPDLSVTLLEPLLRRYDFLVETVADLELADRVTVVRGRAEDHTTAYDVVTARAVAPLDRLVGWCLPLLRPNGSMLLLKGSRAQEELDASTSLLSRHRLQAEVLSARAHATAEPTTIVRVRRA